MAISSIMLLSQSLWFYLTVSAFLLLIIALVFNFFSIFLDFLQAQGCFALLLLLLGFLPAICVLCIAAGLKASTIIILVLSSLLAITGYIVRDTEGNTGKFGYFIMVISIVTLILTLVTAWFGPMF